MDILSLLFIGFIMYLGFIAIPAVMEKRIEN